MTKGKAMAQAGDGEPVSVYLGLGSNLDDPCAHVERAVQEVGVLPQSELLAVSSHYRTAPLGPADQPDFINAVICLSTSMPPLSLLCALQQIERRHGRVRNGPRWGPRTLDLDLLLVGDQQIDLPGLQVPHPQMHCRAFVLVPLAEIAPADLVIPKRGRLGDLLHRLGDSASGLRPLQSPTPAPGARQRADDEAAVAAAC